MSSEEEYSQASSADDNTSSVAADDNSSSDGSSSVSAAAANSSRRNHGQRANREMQGDDATSLYHITVTKATLDDFNGQFDMNMCQQVGVHHLTPLPPGATIPQQRAHRESAIELKWASYSHQRDKHGLFKKNTKKKGTIHMTCLFFKRRITVEGVRWWLLTHILPNIGYANVDVTWAGLQGERDIVASGQTIRANNPPLPLGLRNRAITVQRTRVARLGNSGAFLETDGRHTASRERGGYLHDTTNGSAFPRDVLAEPTDFPILTPAQITRAKDRTRGFPSYTAYRQWVVDCHPQYNDLIQHEHQEIRAQRKNLTREEIDNRIHMMNLAIQWHQDMGGDGCVAELTATTRRGNNRMDGVGTWGDMGVYSGAAVGQPDIIVGSSVSRWTELRNAGVAYINMAPPVDDPQSLSRYLVTSLKHVASDIQEEFGQGCVHMAISLEPNEPQPNSERIDSHACLLTIVRTKNKDTFRITRKLNYLLWYYGLMPKTSAGPELMKLPTYTGANIRYHWELFVINSRFQYHYKVESKYRGRLSPEGQRNHHRYCEIPVMSAGICVEYTCNQHRHNAYQRNRQWLITVDESTLIRAPGHPSHKIYPPLPVYDPRISRVHPTRNDFMRRRNSDFMRRWASKPLLPESEKAVSKMPTSQEKGTPRPNSAP